MLAMLGTLGGGRPHALRSYSMRLSNRPNQSIGHNGLLDTVTYKKSFQVGLVAGVSRWVFDF